MGVEVGDTVTILARGHFRKIDVTRSILGSNGMVHFGVFTGTKERVWFAASDVVEGTRMVADER